MVAGLDKIADKAALEKEHREEEGEDNTLVGKDNILAEVDILAVKHTAVVENTVPFDYSSSGFAKTAF